MSEDDGTLSSILAAIVAGFEHSGTTMVSELLRQAPGIDSGFEGGLLLHDTPRGLIGFAPFFGNLSSTWRVPPAELEKVLDTDDFGRAYRELRRAAQAIEDKQTRLIDKTPRYMQKLPAVLARSPGVPIVVMVRDFRAIVWSSFKRTEQQMERWAKDTLPITLRHTMSYVRSCQQALADDKQGRILVVQYEDLCMKQAEYGERIFKHCGLEFHPEYLSFGKPKYDLVYGNSVETGYLAEYRGNLPDAICERVLKHFAGTPEWFWEP